jgi:hypothetical protein
VKLGVVEHCKVPRKVLDHLDHNLSAASAPCAGAIWHFGPPLSE